MDPKFWNGRKVLITGHTGFKGSWLSLWMQQLGAQVVGISLKPLTTPNLFEQVNVSQGMDSIYQDICDINALKNIFNQIKPEIVFHLAAQSIVRHSYDYPVETYNTNVMGTLNVLESIRSVNTVLAAVIITTDKCYNNREWIWGYRENDMLGGHDPYSSSKAAAEILISSYRDSYYSGNKPSQQKTSIASCRAGNVIGGGDWAKDRLIPDIIDGLINSKAVKIRFPQSVRPWQHVLEPLAGYIMLAEKLTLDGEMFSEAWNFGPSQEDNRSVQWIVDYMSQQWGSNEKWIRDEGKHPHEATHLSLDCTKAHKLLGWFPKWDLPQALDMIIDWHKMYLNGNDCRSVCINQIDEYMKSH